MFANQPNIDPLSFMPFGANSAYIHSSINHFTDAISKTVNTLQAYSHIGDDSNFYYASAYLDINGLSLASSVSTPSRYEVIDGSGLYLFLPFSGFAEAHVDGKKGISSANQHAFFSPEIARTGKTSDLSMVQARICEDRLSATARSMFGERSYKRTKSFVRHPSYIEMQQGDINFDLIYRRLFQLIDDHNLDSNLLSMIGIDDVFYRTLVLMLNSNALNSDEVVFDDTSMLSGINRVTEYISANYSQRVTLTKLEQISGMSGTSLARGFKRRFSCSPMQWLQQYRLKVFNDLLKTARPGETVTSLAFLCGFTRLGALSGQYAQVFGEKPSDTLARSRR